MNVELIEVPSFLIVGFSARTNNIMEMAGLGVMPSLWDKTLSSEQLSSVEYRADTAYYSLYTDYESDEHGEYTYITGVKVTNPPKTLPSECSLFEVSGATFARITTPKGPRPQILIDTWRNIWLCPPSEHAGRRAFKQDFEVYDERAQDPAQSIIDIYLSFT